MEELREKGEVAFSLIGDFGKAHRRFKYHRSEHGFLGCRVKDGEDVIYVNLVGTFGVASTPYWWARIAGCLVRVTHYLIGPGPGLELLLYADDLEALGVGKGGRQASVLSFLYMAALGAPFKWAKQRGGLESEWIGLYTDYATYCYGLSVSRADWMIGWMEGLLERKRESILGSSVQGWEEAPFPGPFVQMVLRSHGYQQRGYTPVGGGGHP